MRSPVYAFETQTLGLRVHGAVPVSRPQCLAALISSWPDLCLRMPSWLKAQGRWQSFVHCTRYDRRAWHETRRGAERIKLGLAPNAKFAVAVDGADAAGPGPEPDCALAAASAPAAPQGAAAAASAAAVAAAVGAPARPRAPKEVCSSSLLLYPYWSSLTP